MAVISDAVMFGTHAMFGTLVDTSQVNIILNYSRDITHVSSEVNLVHSKTTFVRRQAFVWKHLNRK